MDINAAVAAEAAAEAARSKVKGQVTDIQKKITNIVPTLTNLTDKKNFQSKLDDLSAAIKKDKPFIEKSSLAELGEYEKLFTGIYHQVNVLMMDINAAVAAEAATPQSKVTAQVEAIKKKLNSIRPIFDILNNKKDFKSRLDTLTESIEKENPLIENLSLTELSGYEKLFKGIDTQVNVLIMDIISAEAEEEQIRKKSKKTAHVIAGGKKQRKRFTKKKQNNNRHNIKKKRSSIKKNKKRIITRNTRRRIFE